MTGNRRYKVVKRVGVEGPPIPDDEPVLVIRAQDKLAPLMLSVYLSAYGVLGEEHIDRQVINELLQHVDALAQWQTDNPEKVKYADR